MERVGRNERLATPPGIRVEPRARATVRPPRQPLFAPLARNIHLIARRVGALPRHAGLAGLIVLYGSTGMYGAVAGGHVPMLRAAAETGADLIARVGGFGVEEVTISGAKRLEADEIRTIAGIGPRASVLFLDVAAARARLIASPWIAEAQVRKFYPDRVVIDIVERDAFALWQIGGELHVIAEDGTIIAPGAAAPRRFALPLVVGAGAEKHARDLVALLAPFPEIADKTQAAVWVADRRWNLRLKNGIDVRLPEADAAAALAELAALDRDKKLLSRDVLAIDLRLADRITVRLSDGAAKAREETLRARGKRKGSET